MKSCKTLIMLIASAVLCSCYLGGPVFYFDVPGYISQYYYIERSHVLLFDNVENDVVSIDFVSYEENGPSVYNYKDYKKKSNYYKLCCKFGDLYYNQHVAGGDIERHNEVYVYADIVTAINIVSDDDWDSEHPRGALLNDLFCVKGVTIHPYIQSRYEVENVETSIDLPLSNLGESYLQLLTYYEYVTFDHPMPGDAGSYRGGHKFLELYTDCLPEKPVQTLHITLTTDEGKNIEYTVEIDLQ